MNSRYFTTLIPVLFFAGFLAGLYTRPCTADQGFFPLVRARIERQVLSGPGKQDIICHGERICGLRIIPSFYRDRNFEPAWFDDSGLQPTAQRLVCYIEQTDKEGLNPSDYHQATIEQLLRELSTQP
jgi:hypothetical protein